MTIISRMFAIFNGLLKNELNAGGNRITNLAEPTDDGDAATKKYVAEHGGGSVQWDDVLNKPSVFPPEAHEHKVADITDFPKSFAPTAHASTHAADGSDPITPASIGAEASGTAAAAVATHNAATDAHTTLLSAYAKTADVTKSLALRATVADLGNGVFRIADEAVDTTTTEVLY